MTVAISIRGVGGPVRAGPGQTILDAALSQGVAYPHGCRAGNCGACKSSLLAGEVDMGRHSEFALTAAERAQRLILACRAVPLGDVAVAWLDASDAVVHPQRRVAAQVAGVEWAARLIRRIHLRPEPGGPFAFTPGQYARLTFAGQPPRDYAFASQPGAPLLAFDVETHPKGRVGRFLATTLKEGDMVTVEGPFGDAYRRASHRGPILAIGIAAGLGPVAAIVEAALAAGITEEIALYLGARDEPDLYGLAHLQALAAAHANLAVTPVLAQPDGVPSRRFGPIHQAVAADYRNFAGCKAYVAGPPVAVEAVAGMLRGRGVPPADIHAMPFFSEAEKRHLGLE